MTQFPTSNIDTDPYFLGQAQQWSGPQPACLSDIGSLGDDEAMVLSLPPMSLKPEPTFGVCVCCCSFEAMLI